MTRQKPQRTPNNKVLRDNLVSVLGGDKLVPPANYLVLDLETTGLHVGSARIWQLGLYIVADGVPQHEGGLSIWLQTPEADLKKADFEINRRANLKRPQAFNRITKDDKFYADEGAAFLKEVKTQGVDRIQGLTTFINLIHSYVEAGFPIVGQNVAKFDLPHIEWECKTQGVDLDLSKMKLIDTGIMIKAATLGRKRVPRESDMEFYRRVGYERAKGVYFAIERFAIPYWDLDTMYDLDMTAAHNAGFDCYVTSLILKHLLLDAIGETV